MGTMLFEDQYEIDRTAKLIHSRKFSRVALQFPDELLKDSGKVVFAIRNCLRMLYDGKDADIKLVVMADATYGSCCIDEVAAAHMNAELVVHYGDTCLSSTSGVSALFIFRKETVDVFSCARNIINFTSTKEQDIMVLYGLGFAHAIPYIRGLVSESSYNIQFASVKNTVIDASHVHRMESLHEDHISEETSTSRKFEAAGLFWNVPIGKRMSDYAILWIGADDYVFHNFVLRFSSCEIARYDVEEKCLVTDISKHKKLLNRRYYLIEKAKDANIVGILVGTLGVDGYLGVIHQMQTLITDAGKKAYIFVMGRPNPAKIANFPECDVFVYVSCPQTALIDSREYFAPIITPYEAVLAFDRGREWAGEYVTEFRDLFISSETTKSTSDEARYSFIKGGYVEDSSLTQENTEGQSVAMPAFSRDGNISLFTNGTVSSGAEFLLLRRYQGLESHLQKSIPEPYLLGKTGKPSGYHHEIHNDH